MKMSINPASLVLAGLLFICIIISLASAEQQSDVQGQLNKFPDHSLYSLHRQGSADWGVLKVGEDKVYFPWHRSIQPVRPAMSGQVSAPATKEEILLDGDHPTAEVGDLLAINSQKQRDLIYKDSQNGDQNDTGQANSQDISVSGKGGSDMDSVFPGAVDTGVACRGHDADDVHYAGNYLSIDVHDITVSAVNNIKGGSAVATSNIVIEPVQIIVCPSEVNAKLV
jgi:hypothetical protein